MEFLDEVSRAVSLPTVPRRIVCLVPSITETLFALGLGDAVVGVTDYCTHPPDDVARVVKVGGTKDPHIENIVQLLQLQHGADHPELHEPTPTATQIDRLRDLGFLDEDAHKTLRGGWEFLKRLSSRLRIVENRSISDLDEERGDLDALARTLSYAPSQRSDGARRALLEDYAAHTRAIRSVYDRLIGARS